MLAINIRKKQGKVTDFDDWAMGHVNDAPEQKNGFDCRGICAYDGKLSCIGMYARQISQED